jgi:hypothetical protein
VANLARTVGCYGLKPRDPDRRVPIVEHHLRPWEGPVALLRRPTAAEGGAAPLPAAPPDVDRETEVSDWPMYGNDVLGDCFWAGSGHSFGAMSVYGGHPEVLFTDDAIITGYKSTGYIPGDPSTDNGTDPAQGLRFLHKTGLVDAAGKTHKLAAYAFFADLRNFQLMAQVLAATGSLGIGFNCTQGFEQAFAAGEPVTYVPGDPVVGGHWVVLQRRRFGGIGILEEVTWGAVARVTRAYHWATVTDVVMLVSEDYIEANGLSMQGIDLEQLCEDTADAE